MFGSLTSSTPEGYIGTPHLLGRVRFAFRNTVNSTALSLTLGITYRITYKLPILISLILKAI